MPCNFSQAISIIQFQLCKIHSCNLNHTTQDFNYTTCTSIRQSTISIVSCNVQSIVMCGLSDDFHHKILKTLDISKRSLPLDQYFMLMQQAANQQLIAEKILFMGRKRLFRNWILQMKTNHRQKTLSSFLQPKNSSWFYTGIQNARTEL